MPSANQPKTPALREQQLAFAAYIRKPENNPLLQNIAPERMQVYRELFYNNIESTLRSAFPLMHQVLPENAWQKMCHDFFADHSCHTPFLSHLPREFLDFVRQTRFDDMPWLVELAQWEWAEIELMCVQEPPAPSHLTLDVMAGIPKLSPLVRFYCFSYPVHQISKQFVPKTTDAGQHYLLIWRKADDSNGFMQLNAMSYKLLQRIQNNSRLCGAELLDALATEHQEHSAEIILRGGYDMLHAFLHHAFIYCIHDEENYRENFF